MTKDGYVTCPKCKGKKIDRNYRKSERYDHLIVCGRCIGKGTVTWVDNIINKIPRSVTVIYSDRARTVLTLTNGDIHFYIDKDMTSEDAIKRIVGEEY